MDTNDVLTLTLSGGALVASLIAIYGSIWTSNRENKTVIREQMNSLIFELIDTNTAYIELLSTPATTIQEINKRTYKSSLLVERASPLSMQAVSLINQAPDVMNAMDFYLTAEVSRIAQSWEVVNLCYERAIRNSWNTTAFNRVTFRRGYAHTLFEQGNYDEGRRLYKEALEVVPSSNDIYKHMNGYTYLRWYRNESGIVLQGKSSKEQYERAKETYASIKDATARQVNLLQLESVKAEYRAT